MSAFLSVAYADRVEMLTDGAWYEPDGTLIKFAEKVWRSPFLPMAITARGDMGAAQLVAKAIIAAGADIGFDHTIVSVEKMVAGRRAAPAQTRNHYELVIAGISESRGPVQFTFATLAYGGAEAFVLSSPPILYAGPTLTPADVAQLGLKPGAGDDGLAGWGEEFIELARRHAGTSPTRPDLPQHYGIGGHLDLTVIRAEGVTTRRLRTWPDIIGEKIDPFRAEARRAA